MQIIKVVDNDRKYKKTITDQKGKKVEKEYSSINYYIELDNKVWVPIRPSFAKGYAQLDTICVTITNGKK